MVERQGRRARNHRRRISIRVRPILNLIKPNRDQKLCVDLSAPNGTKGDREELGDFLRPTKAPATTVS